MKFIILALALVVIAGCQTRQPRAEPDTEWVLSQYKGQDPVAVDARRIKEGW